MTPEEVITSVLQTFGSNTTADAIVDHLHAAGYGIIRHDAIDGVIKSTADVKAANKFSVGVGGGGDAGRRVVIGLMKRELTSDEAINLAAWLVALSGKTEEFEELLRAVENT